MFWWPPKKSAMGSMSAWDTGWLLAANDSAEDVATPVMNACIEITLFTESNGN